MPTVDDSISDPAQPEKSLIAAVVRQAVRDALAKPRGEPVSAAFRRDRRRAIRWLLSNDPKHICLEPPCDGCQHPAAPGSPCAKLTSLEALELLGIDVDYFRTRLLEVMRHDRHQPRQPRPLLGDPQHG